MVKHGDESVTEVRPALSPPGGRSRLYHVWVAATLLLIGCGIFASLVGTAAVRHNDADKSQKAFQRSSVSVASTLQLAIEHDNDIVADAGGLVSDPTLTNTRFREWASAARVFDRYPEMTGIGAVVLVDAAGLPAFAARAVADPVGTLSADGTFAVVPPGARPFYCLPFVGVARAAAVPTSSGLDQCADPVNNVPLLAARDTGDGDYLPYRAGGKTLLSIQTPIYRSGTIPATVAARRAAFVGWVGTSVEPAVLLIRALRDQPGLSVSLRYQVGKENVSFTHGNPAPGARSTTIDLKNGWTVQTFGVVDRGGLTARGPLSVLIVGSVMSVLLGLLMFVLGTGRERARRQLEQRTAQLHHRALHDALTGLPNRALVMDRIEQMLARNRRRPSTGAVLFLDLDDFKNVNDTLGHGAGDQLLIAVAGRLVTTLRDADTIARMGGDEFVVVIDGANTDVSPELIAERLLDAMRQPFDLDGRVMPLSVGVSIGIATGDRVSAEELLRDADIALYQAKAAGKNGYAVFEPHTQTSISRRTDLEFDLRSALTRDEYRLVYQPIYNLDDLTVVGVEALLRWEHPTLGLISPDEFIPILEQTGQIREVGRWVLQHACRQMATWQAKGDTLDISVNLSARQLDHDEIIADVGEALRASGLPAASLLIEVAETTLMRNPEAIARRLRAIRELGVRIAVDDFGTGYSSLAYLRQFPVDCLKIDRMFTHAITTSPQAKALVGTLVQLGKDLGLSTLAEGVETPAEMDLLREVDVEQAQGFLLARPLDPAKFEEQLLAPTRPGTSTTTRA